MNKRLFFLFIFQICFLFVLGQENNKQQHVKKPNIVFILVDDLGYGDIGIFYQQARQKDKSAKLPYLITANLDKMGENGAIFTNQYSNAPVCAPSRASFLTGMTQGNAQVRNNQFDKALENNHTVASVLKNAGYKTAAIGKWGLQGEKEEGPNWPAHPLKRGFDYYYGFMRHVDGHEHYPIEGIYRGKKEVWENYQEVSKGLDKCYTTDLWTAKAKDWIIQQQKEEKDKPFFLFLAYDTPHAVLELPTQAYPKGKGLKGGLQWLGKSGQMINTASGTPDTYVDDIFKNRMYHPDQNNTNKLEPWPETYVRYATSVKRIDDAVGDLIQLFKDLKIDDQTLVVFTSDNGPSQESYLPKQYVPNHPTFFGSYGPFDGIKRDVWEGGLRVPTIALWPKKINKGTVIDEASMLSDWLATFSEAAQTYAPARSDSESILGQLLNQPFKRKKPIYVEYYEGGNTPDYKEFEIAKRKRKRGEMQMLRKDEWVAVRYNIQSANDPFEIYQIDADPKQKQPIDEHQKLDSLQTAFKHLALQLRTKNSSAARPYDDAKIPAFEIADNNLEEGVNYKFYLGDFNYLPNLEKVQPTTEGQMSKVEHLSFDQDGILVLTGYIKVDSTGTYSLNIKGNQKAIVYLHNGLVLDQDFTFQSAYATEEIHALEKGYHPITMSIQVMKNEPINLSIQMKKDQELKAFDANFYCETSEF